MLKLLVMAVLVSGVSMIPAVSEETPTDHRLFELRTDHAEPGKLDRPVTRFREHICKHFEKHGITNGNYFQLTAGQKGADNTLLDFLAHRDAQD